MACTMARHSSSTVLYHDCVGDSDALPHWINANLSLYVCTRAKPMPCRHDASVRTTVLRFGSKGWCIVGDVRAFFVFSKSKLCSGSQTQGVSFCRSWPRWLVRQAVLGANAPNRAMSPRKEHNSLTLFGCWKFRSTVIFFSHR